MFGRISIIYYFCIKPITHTVMAICPFCNKTLALKAEKIIVTGLNRDVTTVVCINCNKPIGILDNEIATQLLSKESSIQKDIARYNEINQNVEKIYNDQ